METKKERAKEALIHFYNYVAYEKTKFDDDISDEKIKSFITENNDLIIGAILSEATDEERKFLYDKYYYRKSFVSLSMKMHVHINGLQRWRDKILDEISTLLNFELPSKDIYSRNKVEVLVYVMQRIMCFYKHYNFEAEGFIKEMGRKLRLYSTLLSNIYFCLYADKQEIEYEIIRTKIVNPHITIKELMELTGTSNATIYNYLHAFADVKKFVDEC